MVRSESLLELSPSEPGVRGEHCHMILPPYACGTPQLLGCQSCFIPIIVWVQGKLGLDSPKPAICFQWLIYFVKQRRLSAQKLLISRDSRLVVMFMPLRSALLHNLPEECRLFVSSGEHGRNGLGQIRRVRWACHSAFNYGWICYIFLIT